MAMALVRVYFNASEYITAGYKMESVLPSTSTTCLSAPSPYFWFYVIGGLIIPAFIIAFPPTRTIKGLSSPPSRPDRDVDRALHHHRRCFRVPHAIHRRRIRPTLTEWSILAGAFALFALIISVFAKIFPMVSVWEVVEHRGPEPDESLPGHLAGARVDGLVSSEVAS